jgi:HAD superfamily phosphatase (TIGR01681 family)
MSQSLKGLLISDFNVENLSAYLQNDSNEPQVRCEVAPYGQVTQILLDGDLPFWQRPLDFLVVWTRPEAVLASFAEALDGFAVAAETILAEVDDYCQKLLLAKSRARVVFVPIWVIPAFHSGHGVLDLAPEVGISRILMQANMRLLENLDAHKNVFPLHTAKWAELVGEKTFNPRLWYLGKVPFGNELFRAAVRDLKSALRGIGGHARKLIILDLDDTLWGGIVGDLGWQEIILGGHDPAGEALVDFQRELKAMSRRGIVLAIVSKNEELVALEAISKHPEMILRKEDFAGWRINWKDKAQNIVELLAELNLGLDSAIFIDDNPAERARVRDTLPDVFVPEWPADKRLYPQALRSLDCFDKPRISDEDRQRLQMYANASAPNLNLKWVPWRTGSKHWICKFASNQSMCQI